MLSKINFKSIKTGSQPDAPEHQEGHKENTWANQKDAQ